MPDQTPTLPPRMVPRPTDAEQDFWNGGADGRLLIGRCDKCEQLVHPPVARCPHCAGPLVAVAVSGEAVVITYTVAYQQFNPAVPTPFVIALVELVEQRGLRLPTNIVDCPREQVHAGMSVWVRFEQHGDAFVPVFAPRSPTRSRDEGIPR